MTSDIEKIAAYRNSADLWLNPLGVSDVFAMTARVSMHPGERKIVRDLTDAPLLVQKASLRDKLRAQGAEHMTVTEFEKSPFAGYHVLSEGSLLYVAKATAPDDVALALTQRSRTNPATGEMVNSPEAYSYQLGKVEQPDSYLEELNSEIILERDVSRKGGIHRSAVLFSHGGSTGISKADKREQLRAYEAWNKINNPANPFRAEEAGIRVAAVELYQPDVAKLWTVETQIAGRVVHAFAAIPFFNNPANTFAATVPLKYVSPDRYNLGLVAMEPSPAQKALFVKLEDLQGMRVAPVKPKPGEEIGGRGLFLVGATEGLLDDRQAKLFEQAQQRMRQSVILKA